MAMQPSLQKQHIIQRPMRMGILLIMASIGWWFLMIGCSEALESKRKQNTMNLAEQPSVSKTDNIHRFPPIDTIAPAKTETATFALG